VGHNDRGLQTEGAKKKKPL